MPDSSPLLALPYIQPSQAQKHVTHNEALQLLDGIVQLRLASIGTNAPPVGPTIGDVHAVGPAGGGDWAGQSGQLAIRTETGWVFAAPLNGWRGWDIVSGEMRVFDGTNWTAQTTALQNLAGVGIGTSSDPVNKLAVSADATLLNHDGNGHQLKINKNVAGDTASLLFQTGFSGRAEMGTAGSDAFTFKLSPDGSTWSTGLSFTTGGVASMLAGTLIDGAQAYHQGNILGTVSEASGVPTGAVLESGSNANGAYIRYADGTQICTHALPLAFLNTSTCRSDWTFPAAFSANPVVNGTVNTSASSGTSTPAMDEILPVTWGASGTDTTVAQLSVRRVAGSTNFVGGDQISVQMLAMGRWF